MGAYETLMAARSKLVEKINPVSGVGKSESWTLRDSPWSKAELPGEFLRYLPEPQAMAVGLDGSKSVDFGGETPKITGWNTSRRVRGVQAPGIFVCLWLSS